MVLRMPDAATAKHFCLRCPEHGKWEIDLTTDAGHQVIEIGLYQLRLLVSQSTKELTGYLDGLEKPAM